MPKRMAYDRWLFFTTALLAVGGLFMVGSASNYVALDFWERPSAYLFKHLFHLALGFVVMLGALTIRYQRLANRSLTVGLLALCFAGLLLVLAMPAAHGAHRWIPIGILKLQPSELAKLAVVIFMASLLARREEQVNEFASVPLPGLLVVGGMALLVVIEPDLGSAVLMVATAGVMIFMAGLSWKWIAGLGGMGVAGFLVGVVAEPYRLERIKSFLNPSLDTLGSNFQLTQSLIAVGSGGLTGVGLGQGHQKAFYVPAAHTDFIYAVVGEELGLVGTGLLLVAFLIIFWRGLRAAVRAPDRFGFYLALGLTSLFVVQALINIGVCLGLLPTKGLPLPLVSYGGSSLVTSLAAMGLLLNVSQHSN